MSGFEENEVSKNAFGGTELAKRRLAGLIDPDLLSNFQIICSRPREFEMDKIRVFWCHDLPEDPESAKFKDREFLDNIHKFVFISNWQQQRYELIHGLKYDDKCVVLESGIDPSPVVEKPKGKINLVYTSTPQRGLEILIPVFEHLAKDNPDIHLHVFSSFKIYGWDEMDKQFEPLYDQVRNHPQMTYHGFVPNNELRDFLANEAHIFAYPSIWLETSCRAMLEAMSARVLCVHPNFGALPETSGCLNIMYQGDFEDKNAHANAFIGYLEAAIRLVREEKHEEMLNFNKFFVDSRFNINRVKNQWDMTLNKLLAQYPTVESRAKPKAQFIYRTS